jgi:hypothetical protein
LGGWVLGNSKGECRGQSRANIIETVYNVAWKESNEHIAIILSQQRRGEERMMMWMNLTMIDCTTIKYHVEVIYANKMFTKEKNIITIAPTHPLMSICPKDSNQSCQSHVCTHMYNNGSYL